MNSKNILGSVAAGTLTGLFWLSAAAQGTPVADPYSQTRTSSFTYYGAADGAKYGLLKSETVEPDAANLCVVTTHDYDAYGNKTTVSTANCAGASGRALFDSRGNGSTFAAQTVSVAGQSVTTPAGTFATSASNALSQSESRTYDPRFGAVLSLTGPNALTTNWTLDDFGRPVREQRADNTATVTYYCYISGRGANDLSSNTAGCPSPGASEIPADALMFVHSEPRNTSNAKSGPFSRVYTDRAGRKIRSVTEAFDGANQAGGTARLIVQDTDYNQYGVQVVVTQPYFFDTGSSTGTGASNYGMTRTDVDALGRPVAIYTADAQGQAGSQTYGSRGSRVSAKVTITYAGLTTTTTDDKGQTRKEEKNVDGKLVRVTDALGAQIVHQHDAFGNLVKTKDALGNIATIAYDARGRKVSVDDPDSGLWKYDYDALGQLVWQQSAKQRATAAPGDKTTMAYDKLGRMTSRVEPEYTSTWNYDTYAGGVACPKGIGKLCESNTSTGINKKVVYDSLGRPSSARTTVTSGPSFASALAYDSATGRLASQTYPSGVRVNYNYTAKGYLSTLTLAQSVTLNPLPTTPGGTPGGSLSGPAGGVLWRAQSYNAWGKPEKQDYGNGVSNRAVYEAFTGRTNDLQAGVGSATNVLNHQYSWNSLGQLTQRNDANGDGSTGAVSDTYTYDSIGRLQQYRVDAPGVPNLSRTVTLQYNALGMVLYKSDVGVYTYGAQATAGVKPHALQSVAGASTTSYSYDANGNLSAATAGKYRSISYTSFNLPDSQTGLQGPSGSPKYSWVYDENHQRIKETRVVAGVTRTTWSQHPDNQGGLSFECDSASNANCASADTSQRHYLSAGGMSIGVLVSTGPLPTLAASQTTPPAISSITLVKVEYWHKDHLGSLIATTDHAAAVTARYAYDPFGKRRTTAGAYDAFGNLVIDWTSNTNSGNDRGYTGHEHLDDVGLIHMNGRIFDPTLGRFMQTDPFVQDPGNLQNFDRYAYCYNSPTTCTDPSGYFLKWLERKIRREWKRSELFRSVVSIAVAWYLGPAGGALNGITTNVVAQSAIAGFASGAVATGSLDGALQGAFTAAAFAGVGNVIQGGEFFAGGGTAGSLAGVGGSKLAAVALHGVVGCVTSVAGGGKCGPGALSAAFSEAATVNGLQASGPAGILTSAVIGGTASVLGGGKFANGAQTAAFGYLFNHLAHLGINVRVPLVGGASIGVGVSYEKGQWDAGVIVESDGPVPSGGKLLAKTTVELGYQEGDFTSNKGEMSKNVQFGYKTVGASIQQDPSGRVTGGALSVGPQLGVEVSYQQTRTVSIRTDVVPAVKAAIDRVKSWFGP